MTPFNSFPTGGTGCRLALAWLRRLLLLASALFSVSIAQAFILGVSGDAGLGSFTNTPWTLQKSGVFVPGATTGTGTINWTVTVTKDATTAETVVIGYVDLLNQTAAPIPIRGIVVSLQQMDGEISPGITNWVTVTSNIADSTDGDAATSTPVDSRYSTGGVTSMAENAFSGALTFTDAANNPVVLNGTGQVVPVGGTLRLNFVARFSTTFSAGTPLQIETIVNIPETTLADLEPFISAGSVYTEVTAPEPVDANAEVHLVDNNGSIITSGTATVGSFAGINLLLTGSGTFNFSVGADGGTDGGSACNTATLTSPNTNFAVVVGETAIPVIIPGISLAATNCQDIPKKRVPTQTTFTMGGWGAVPSGNNPGTLLWANFAALYPKGLVVGGNYKLTFTSASAVTNALPVSGTPAVLTKSITNPGSALTNTFAGQTVALKLNVDFSAKGLMPVNLANLGSMKIASGKLAGWTVNQVLALCNTVLGGNTGALPAGVSVSNLNDIADGINNAFNDAEVNTGYLTY